MLWRVLPYGSPGLPSPTTIFSIGTPPREWRPPVADTPNGPGTWSPGLGGRWYRPRTAAASATGHGRRRDRAPSPGRGGLSGRLADRLAALGEESLLQGPH